MGNYNTNADEIAVRRLELVSPLIAEGIDAGRMKQLKERICQQTGVSERTLRRYLSKYREEGFDGLKPKKKAMSAHGGDAVPAHILEQAILLRREVSSRSVAQIIQILEWEGIAQPGQIKRSTLQEKLAESGYS